jgi:disease resistance protein RPS2
MVDAADRQGMEATSQGKWWLECIAALEDTVTQIVDEYQAGLQLPPRGSLTSTKHNYCFLKVS